MPASSQLPTFSLVMPKNVGGHDWSGHPSPVKGEAGEGASAKAASLLKVSKRSFFPPRFIAEVKRMIAPTSRVRLEEGFQRAGLETFTPDSPGVGYVLPDGSRVRIMEPTRYAPPRACFTNANDRPISPFTGKPVHAPQGLSPFERKAFIRERTHITLH